MSTEARAHALLLASQYLLCVLALSLLWLALPGSGLGHALIALALTLPLLAPLPGLWQRHRRTAVWAVFLLAPYLAVALMEVVANPPARIVAALVIASAFATAVLLIAWLRISRLQSRSGVVPPNRA